MVIFKRSEDLLSYLGAMRKLKTPVGFVPTMGALHNGHISLLEKSKKYCSVNVCSIFINPTQFNNADDYKKYPVTTEEDIRILEENGCDILFLPSEKEVYPDSLSKQKHFELGYIETILEGKYRPGHFQGVCLIMEKLLNMVKPDFLFLGQKDFQQCLVIKKLIELIKIPVTVVICPIMREADGLAMSSRNTRLSGGERERAPLLHQVLQSLKSNINASNFKLLKEQAISSLHQNNFRVDYLELARREDLKICEQLLADEPMILLLAAFAGEVRLIDNLYIN